MAGFAAAAEDLLATAKGEDVGECGTKYLCGTPPAPTSGGFNNKRTLNGLKVAGKTISVDAEIGGSGLGQVHVHIKGAGKILVESVDDLQNLPGSVRKSAAVREAIAHGFEWLSKLRGQ